MTSRAARYQRLKPAEHVLRRPDTYVGSVQPRETELYTVSENGDLIHSSATVSAGFLKIFDEILVNAADNRQRDKETTKIEVKVEDDRITVKNNGRSLPVEQHPTELDDQDKPVWVPELVFGNMMAGENFDDDELRTVGGRNGLGAKLTNIFSKEFCIELVENGKKYCQKWRDNMTQMDPPSVRSSKVKSYTQISFVPDLTRFGMTEIDATTVAAMRRRAYDVAGCLGKGVTVWFNKTKVPIPSFAHYTRLASPDAVVAELGSRWTIGVAPNDSGAMRQFSFVNGIDTAKGGTHVELVASEISKQLRTKLSRKIGGFRPAQIKSQLFVFVNCLVENPAFSSQTKEELTTHSRDFGSSPDWTSEEGKKFLNRIAKGTVGKHLSEWAERRSAEVEDRELAKSSGVKRQTVRVEKLEDANWAGGRKSEQCTLILTEGDSAKALAMAGLAVVGRNSFGVFPLKGKPLNVRDASAAQVAKNQEIQNVVKIMGLKFGQDYSQSIASLRYGRLCVMADQDVDGSHIKGLVVNLFAKFWPSLLRRPQFLQQFITPIVKARRGAETRAFYTLPDFEAWKDETPDADRWRLKYYKGLGTSTSVEAREYFNDLSQHRLDFSHTSECEPQLDLAFNKSRAADRRGWLNAMDPDAPGADYSKPDVSFANFVDLELIQFSRYDNQRSIPSAIDGLKPSQRKVLFACFKRRLQDEIKVGQLAGYVSEHSAYHHGEQSLNMTIVGMAQDFVGVGWANLLEPIGQFGTRDRGGKDAASPRYIFTKLAPIARLMFPESDDGLLKTQTDDGLSIEPETYSPVVPVVLLNGADGIGTGWSTYVPPYDPLEVISNVRRMLDGDEMSSMHPSWRNFTGSVVSESPFVYIARGVAKVLANGDVEVTELPPGVWTQSFKEKIEKMVEDGTASSFENRSTDTNVHFLIKGLETTDPIATLKLEKRILTSNMHLFASDGKIKKFSSACEVIRDFFQPRLDLYVRRRASLIEAADVLARSLDAKARFILAVCEGRIDLRRPEKEVIDRLVELDLPDHKPLLSMKLSSLNAERVEELKKQRDDAIESLERLRATLPETMWRRDLDALEAHFASSSAPSSTKRQKKE